MPLDPAQRHQIEQDPVMTKLTDTQTIILSAGAQRPDNIALPLPKGCTVRRRRWRSPK